MSTAKKAYYVSDRMSYIILRGRRCNIIVVDERGSSDDKHDDSKDNFMEIRAGFRTFS